MTCNMHKKDIAKKMNHQPGKAPSWKPYTGKKGKGSLNSTGKNEGENMMMGKNGTQRA